MREIVWKTVERDIPALKVEIAKILDRLSMS